MDYKKITDKELENVGVIGLGDTPELSTQEMQAKFEETVRSVVIPAFNRLVEDLLTRDTQLYTKDEVITLISQRVTAIGAGDMAKSVYDSDNDGVVDWARKLRTARKIGNAKFDGTADISLADIGAATSAQGTLAANITTDIKYIKYVTALPSSPDASTLYLVKK